MSGKVLLIEDDKALAASIKEKLTSEGYEIDWFKTGEAGVEKAKHGNYNVAILDYMLPGMDGLQTLELIMKDFPEISVIFITAYGNHELAIKSLQLGAAEYINKPFNFNNLSFYVYKLIKEKELKEELSRQEKAIKNGRGEFICRSQQMEKILRRLPVYASSGLPILICGETGTGKDLIASLIYNHPKNPRNKKPFFAVNCMAIPDTLIESELFGHVKGAFTGALLDKKGFFEVVDGGIIYLDEISGATSAVQGKLLRTIENGEFYRVGDTRLLKTDVLVIASTSKDLFDEMQSGRFRQDLYYRLAGLRIELPPLRERREEILPLANYFLRYANEKWVKNVLISDEVLSTLDAYNWPGNVRELKNLIFTTVSTSENDVICIKDLPDEIRRAVPHVKKASFAKLRELTMREFEKAYFTSLLRKSGGNISHAAREAGIARQNLFQKLKKLHINPNSFR